MATAGYIQQAPVAVLKEGSELPTLEQVATIVPDLELRTLQQAMTMNLNEINDSKLNIMYVCNLHTN